MGRGLRGFRLLPERRLGWGGGYVGSGFCRKGGWDGEGVTWIPAFAGKAVGMGRGLRRFRLSPERRLGWGGGYVDSGFCRKGGWDGLGVTWIPAFAGKAVGMGRGLRGFRLLPERRLGWVGGYVDSGCSPERRHLCKSNSSPAAKLRYDDGLPGCRINFETVS